MIKLAKQIIIVIIDILIFFLFYIIFSIISKYILLIILKLSDLVDIQISDSARLAPLFLYTGIFIIVMYIFVPTIIKKVTKGLCRLFKLE